MVIEWADDLSRTTGGIERAEVKMKSPTPMSRLRHLTQELRSAAQLVAFYLETDRRALRSFWMLSKGVEFVNGD